MKKNILVSLLIGLNLITMNAFAQSDKNTDTIKQSLSAKFPMMPKIEEIKKTNMEGIFEVRLPGAEIVYTDVKGEFIIANGDMLTSKNGQIVSLTKERVEEFTKIDFKEFNLKNAVKTVKGNGKNKIVTFEDPNCGYCKKLHPELEKLNNVTIYTFLYPILGPDSVEKSRNIWCSKDKTKAWNDYMDKQVTPTKADDKCKSDVLNENIAFATSKGIKGTPQIYFENGKKIGGYSTSEKIEEILNVKK